MLKWNAFCPKLPKSKWKIKLEEWIGMSQDESRLIKSGHCKTQALQLENCGLASCEAHLGRLWDDQILGWERQTSQNQKLWVCPGYFRHLQTYRCMKVVHESGRNGTPIPLSLITWFSSKTQSTAQNSIAQVDLKLQHVAADSQQPGDVGGIWRHHWFLAKVFSYSTRRISRVVICLSVSLRTLSPNRLMP